MHATHHRFGSALLGVGSLLSIACSHSSSPAEPATTTTGALAITIATTSAAVDIDPDGYTLSIDGGPARAVGVSGTLTIGELPSGTHVLQLGGVAANCTVDGLNPRSVRLSGGDAAPVQFTVFCFGGIGGAGAWDY